MAILDTITLESNKQLNYFNSGDLSSDGGLMHVVYQITSACFQDDCADELTKDPVMTAILEKDKPALQPALSRFGNRMDIDTLSQFDQSGSAVLKIVRSVGRPDLCCLIRSSPCWTPMAARREKGQRSLSGTWLSPLLCCDGLARDLLKSRDPGRVSKTRVLKMAVSIG